MIGELAGGVFRSFVAATVRPGGVVEHFAVELDRQFEFHFAVGEGADGSGNEKFAAGIDDGIPQPVVSGKMKNQAN